MGKDTRYLKHAENGTVHIWTIPLAKRDDMLPCDKDGELLSRAHARRDMSDLSLREKIDAALTKEEIIDIGARYDMGFDSKLDLDEMKQLLINALIEMALVDPTDEEAEAIAAGESGTKDKDYDEEAELEKQKAQEASDAIREAIEKARSKKAVRTIGLEHGYTECPEDLDEAKMASMKSDLVEYLEEQEILVAEE